MSVKVEVKMDPESMADFMVYNIYTSPVGIGSSILGVLNIGLAMVFAYKRELLLTAVFFLFAFVIICIFPYYIRQKVRKKMEHSRRLADPVVYEFMEDGISTVTADDSGKASWNKFKRAVGRKNIIILYDDKKQAIILPIVQLGGQYTEVVDMIFMHMPAPAVRIRRTDNKKVQPDQQENRNNDSGDIPGKGDI